MKAIITKDRARVVMVKTSWRHTVKAEDLPKWIGLYRGLRDRNAPKGGGPGPYHQFYAADVEALEAAARQIAEARQ